MRADQELKELEDKLEEEQASKAKTNGESTELRDIQEAETVEEFPLNQSEIIEELTQKNSNLTNVLDCLKKQMDKDKLLHYSFNYIVKLQEKDDRNIIQSIEQEVNKYMALGQEDRTELDISLRNLVNYDNSYER